MSKMSQNKKNRVPQHLVFGCFWLKIKDLKVFDTTSGLKSCMNFNIKQKCLGPHLRRFDFFRGTLKHTRTSWVNGEFFGRFPVVFEKIGDVFGMFRQNSAILCAPLRACETPHFRALSKLMRVPLCAAKDFPRTVSNLQSNVAIPV